MSLAVDNFYSHIKKSEGRTYPNEDKVNIKIPARILLLGPSGSGKTNVALNIVKHIGVFTKIVLLAKDLEEPLYKHLIETYREAEKKLKRRIMLAITKISELPSIDDFNPDEDNLLICDDLICEAKTDLAKVEEFWIRGRKKSITMMFLSQGYYHVPKKIRQNSQYIIIKKIDTPKDLKALLREYALGGVEPQQLLQMYHQATDGDFTNFFMIDTLTSEPALRFRKNYG